MALEKSGEGLSDWLLNDLVAIASKMEDGRYLRDLSEIGNSLCEFDRETTLQLLAQRAQVERIDLDLDRVLPFYLPLLEDSVAKSGEETFMNAEQCTALLQKHQRGGALPPPRLPLESGQHGYALLQAAAMLAGIDDALVGTWYLKLQAEMQRAQGAAAL